METTIRPAAGRNARLEAEVRGIDGRVALAIALCIVALSAVAAVTTLPSHGEATADINGGDSRVNNYRLERDSCCVGEH